MMQKNTITVTSDKITQPLTFAFAADFHNGDADEALSLMRGCDAILIGGDLVNRHSRHGWRNAARFLNLAPRVAPTFYNLGNYERLLPDIAEYLPLVQKSDVTVLDDCFWTSAASPSAESAARGKCRECRPFARKWTQKSLSCKPWRRGTGSSCCSAITRSISRRWCRGWTLT